MATGTEVKLVRNTIGIGIPVSCRQFIIINDETLPASRVFMWDMTGGASQSMQVFFSSNRLKIIHQVHHVGIACVLRQFG